MSNIFNLLGGIVEPDKGQVLKSMARSKTFHEIRPNTVKTMGSAKLKGLSIRSNSDMNVSQSTCLATIKKDTCSNKEQNFLKPKVTQADTNGCPISPETEAKETTTPKMRKALSDDVFKKPMSFKKSVKKCPKPEKLASWHDNQHEFDYGYIETIEKEFNGLLSKGKENIMTLQQEKAFISETLDLMEIPDLAFDTSIDEEYKKCMSLDLPEISDISDDDYL